MWTTETAGRVRGPRDRGPRALLPRAMGGGPPYDVQVTRRLARRPSFGRVIGNRIRLTVTLRGYLVRQAMLLQIVHDGLGSALR